VLCAGSALLLAKDESTSVINGALVGVILSQSASPSVVFLSSPRMINLGFLTEGKLAAILITPSSWGSQRAGHSSRNKQQVFQRRCRGGSRRLLRGEFLHAHPLLCYCFSLLYFYLHHFIKNTKKLVPTIVVIFVGMLLSCFIMLSINGWFL
jgi:hypothetical protein